MIRSFKHKGLKNFFETGSTAGIKFSQRHRIRTRLSVIDNAKRIEDINLPGFNLHALKGDKSSLWSVTVSGNYRITFEFEFGHAYIINYEDYH